MREQLSDAGLAGQLRYRFGLRGAIDASVDTNIQLVADVAELRAPFHATVGGVFSLQSGPVAAQLSYVGLRAPTNLPANFRARVSLIGAFPSGGTVSCLIKIANSAALDAVLAGPAVNVINGSWDSPPPDQPAIRQALQSYQTTNVAAFGQDGFLLNSIAGANTMLLQRDWVLAPGNTLFIQHTVVNTALVGSFYWDEFYVG